ncbi:MAG: hypothetical protein LLG37_10025 [Spirochaetia bacterium]|nr:hypothetical protein [Spirochaetia bacterium]
MTKKSIAILAALLLPLALFAAETAIKSDSQAYADIKTLSDNSVIDGAVEKESLTRAEAAGFVANGAENVRSGKAADASAEDLEKLYGLVKMFQTDMMAKGMPLGDIEDMLVLIKVKQERLNKQAIEDKADKLLANTGFKINGEGAVYMTDLNLNGNAFTANERYRPITQHLDLIFSAKPSKSIYGEAIFRIENLYGGFWGAQNIYGVRRFFIEGENNLLKFTAGDYRAKLTPFTMWAVEDERPYEAKVFSDKKEMNKKELYLGDNKWPLTGGMVSGRYGLFDAVGLEVDIMAARVGGAAATVATPYSDIVSAINYVTYTASNFVYPHDRYLAAGRLASDCGLKDMLKIGLNFTEIKDAEDTGVMHGSPYMDNYVGSADANLQLLGIVKIYGEFAYSGYYVGTTLPASHVYAGLTQTVNSYLCDTAVKAGASAELFNTKLEGYFSVVGNSFTAYAAQTRMYDEAVNFPYLTQNNTWNASKYYYGLNNVTYPFTRYNQSIMAGYLPTGRNLMPYSNYLNYALPYGDSTPNRQGFTAKLSGNYLNGMLAPSAKFVYTTEFTPFVSGGPRDFLVVEGGLKAKIWKIAATAGYKFEKSQNYKLSPADVDLTTGIIDAGLEFEPNGKWLFTAGFSNTAFSGNDVPYSYNASSGLWEYASATQAYDTAIMSYGASIEHRFAQTVTLGLSYTGTVITDNMDTANSFMAQEIDLKIIYRF